MADWNTPIIEEFRNNNGVVGDRFAGAHLLLLTTVGAKSGESRTSPMMFFPDGDDRLVVASKAGAPTHPAWYHNLLANPKVHVEASIEGGVEEYDAIATPLPEAERIEQFARIELTNPGFGEYQKKTTRKIPLVVLKRIAG